MSLFHIVKNVNEPELSFNSPSFILSESFCYFFEKELNYIKENNINIQEIILLHPYSFVFSIHPIHKERIKKNNFCFYYELSNIFQTFKIHFNEVVKNITYSNSPFSYSPIKTQIIEQKTPLSFLSFTKHPDVTDFFIEKVHEHPYNTHCYNTSNVDEMVELIKNSFDKKFDILLVELNEKDYLYKELSFHLLIILYFILNNQNTNSQSMFIFKIKNINDKIAQFLYILSYLFSSTTIYQSQIKNKYTNEKYIFCKYLHSSSFFDKKKKIKQFILKEKKNISLLKNNLPLFFLNNINEINNLMTQQQLTCIEDFIHLQYSSHKVNQIKLYKENIVNTSNDYL